MASSCGTARKVATTSVDAADSTNVAVVKESLTTESTKVEVKTKRKYNRKPKA